VKRLIVCRNRFCRDTGTYPDDLVATLRRAGFLLRDILAGTDPSAAGKNEAQAPVPPQTGEHPVTPKTDG
jgi:hypothetical protein